MIRKVKDTVETNSWKKSVRDALLRLPRNLQIKDIAIAAGIDPVRLYNFTSKGILNGDEVRTIELFLIREGYMENPEPTPNLLREESRRYMPGGESTTQHELLSRLARRLYRLADDIADPDASEDDRIKEFGREIKAIFEGLDETGVVFEKKPKNIG
ncbi:MAG: hypothetical protein IIB38_16845 [Candidatus Hydrogenedentes bacterium]|nr:hypothetical protein [Candidatus Hydrogenedentota bacterium]